MTFSFNDLNLGGVEAERASTRLPVGKHVVKVTSAELKPARSGGTQMVLKFSGVNGEGTAMEFLNIKNSSSQAEEIARRRLKAILTYGGHPNPDKPSSLKEIEGLVVGIIMVDSEFTNDKGDTFKTSDIKSSGAFFDPADLGYSAPAKSPGGLDDEIPF